MYTIPDYKLLVDDRAVVTVEYHVLKVRRRYEDHVSTDIRIELVNGLSLNRGGLEAWQRVYRDTNTDELFIMHNYSGMLTRWYLGPETLELIEMLS